MTKKKKYSEEYLDSCRKALEAEKTRSLSETTNWEHVDREKVHKDWDNLYKELAKLIDSSNPEDIEVQKLVARHFEIASRFYVPSKEAYIGMTLFYNENKDFRDYHNNYHPKLVDFLAEAIRYYAEENLL